MNGLHAGNHETSWRQGLMDLALQLVTQIEIAIPATTSLPDSSYRYWTPGFLNSRKVGVNYLVMFALTLV